MQPSVLEVTRCAFSRTWLRATKNSMSQCPHASAAGTPCAPPCLPVLALPPSSPRGCVAGTALPQSGCRSGWVMPEPCSCSMPLRHVLPTLGRGGLPLWLLALVLPPLLGSAPASQKLAGKHVAGKEHNSFVALFVLCRYQGTITWHCVPAWLVMTPWGTGMVSPQGERGSVVGGLLQHPSHAGSASRVSAWGWAAGG